MNESVLITIANEEGCAAVTSETAAPEAQPIEGLNGWTLLFYTAEKAGLDYVVLNCEAGADVNPLHSGGDVNWLGYVEQGPVELILGDSSGNRTSSRVMNKGDFMLFEPETQHGWVPGNNPAKIVFVKTSD